MAWQSDTPEKFNRHLIRIALEVLGYIPADHTAWWRLGSRCPAAFCASSKSRRLAGVRAKHHLLRIAVEGELDLSRVHKKIGEAQFFLAKMSERERHAFGDHVQFDYYLSAFLNAGRTVDYRLCHEQKAIYKPWRKAWNARLTSEENSLIKFMVDDRNDEVHESGSSRSVGQEDIKVGAGSSYSDGSGTLEVFGSPGVLLGSDTAVVIQRPTYCVTIDGAERSATEAAPRT
jgi:hypothetical protein